MRIQDLDDISILLPFDLQLRRVPRVVNADQLVEESVSPFFAAKHFPRHWSSCITITSSWEIGTPDCKMFKTERTPLRPVRVLKYDPLQMHSNDEFGNDHDQRSTTVQLLSGGKKSPSRSRVVRTMAVLFLVFAAFVVFVSLRSPGTKPTTPADNTKHIVRPLPKRPVTPPHKTNPIPPPHKIVPVAPIEKAAWSAIAQPLSILDPESLGFLAIDRPPISMPGPIFGELLNLKVPLPTNSWCENLFLGASNTESTNRVYQVPYVIDTEVHGNLSTQGVETHPAHVQANKNMVEVRHSLPSVVSFLFCQVLYQNSS